MPDSVLEIELRQACSQLDRRLRSGQRRVAEAIFESYPSLRADDECAVELIYAEYVTLSELGEEPDVQSLCLRFPQYGERLSRLIKIHNVLGPENDGDTPRIGMDSGTISDDSSLIRVEPRATGETHNPRVQRIGQYELLEEIARGGMGIVWKARQLGLGRIVAVKRIRDPFPDSLDRRRFLAEAETAARLQHRNIAQVFEVGNDGDGHFLSMEYVDGGNLGDRLATGSLPARQAAQLIEKVARAVDFAHNNGVVHRDLKPANILLTAENEPKITDFGLAKKLSGDATQYTRSGAVLGTPTYMAPEQASGQNEIVGPATDVHALGAILYEMLGGKPPFQGISDIDTLKQICDSDAVSLRREKPETPRDLDTICLRCLSKAPGYRYASAGALAEELRRFLDGEPIRARSITRTERVWKWVHRRPVTAALLLAILLVTLAGFAGISWQWRRAEREWQRAEGESLRLQSALDTANRATHAEAEQREKSEVASYYHSIALAQYEIEHGNSVGARRVLDQCSPRRRGWEWHYLNENCQQERIQFDDVGIWSVRFSPDAKLVALGIGRWGLAEARTVKLRDARTGELVRELAGPDGEVMEVSFGPDGTRLAAVCVRFGRPTQRGLVVWDVETGDAVPFPANAIGANFSVDFSPDGSRIATGGSDGMVRIWDTENGQMLKVFTGHRDNVFAVAFSPDGRQLASGSREGIVHLWDVRTGQSLHSLQALDDVRDLAYRPDGRFLAAGTFAGNVQVWELKEDPRLSEKHHLNFGSISCIRYTPDGRFLAVSSPDRGIVLIDPVTAQRQIVIASDDARVYSLDFSSDGEQLLAGGRFIARVWDVVRFITRVWDVTLPRSNRLIVQSSHIADISWSPDANRIAVAARLNQVRFGSGRKTLDVVDTRTRKVTASFPHGDWLTGTDWSRDGRLLASSCRDGTVFLWNAHDHRHPLATLNGHTGQVLDIAFHPNSSRVASAGNDGAIRLWDCRTGRLQRTVKHHDGPVHAVVFFPCGDYVVSAGTLKLRIWNAATGDLSASLDTGGNHIRRIALSRSGKHLAAACGNSVYLWSIVYHPEGTPTASELRRLAGHTGTVSDLSFDSTGRRLVSCSPHCEVIVWDAEHSCKALQLDTGWNEASRVAFNPHSRELIAACGGALRFAKPRSGRPLADAIAGRNRELILWHREEARAARSANDRSAVEFHEQLVTRRHEQIVDALSGADSDPRSLARARRELGHAYRAAKRDSAAEKTYCQSLVTFEELLQASPENAEYRIEIANTLVNLCVVFNGQQRWDESNAAYQRAVSLSETAFEASPRNPWFVSELARSLDDFRAMLHQTGKREEATRVCRRLLDARGKLVELSPNNDTYHADLARAHRYLNQFRKAAEHYEHAIALAPHSVTRLNGLAWMLATCPDRGARDPQRAVALARRAVDLSPDNGNCWNTLGVAQYRTDDLRSALVSLEKSMRLRGGGDSHDYFFIALIHARNGDPIADHWLNKAIEWMQQNAPNDDELKRFREEVERMLGTGLAPQGVRQIKSSIADYLGWTACASEKSNKILDFGA